MNKYLKIVLPVLLAGGCLAVLLAALGGMARAEPLAWTEAQQMPEAFGGPGFVQCPDDPESFYLVGGAGPSMFQWRDEFYKYNTASDSWTTLAPLPQTLFGVAATCYEGKIYAAGGWRGYAVAALYIYDIATNTWMSGPDLPRVVSGAALGAWDGKLYLFGGSPVSLPSPPVPDVDIYDLVSGTWSAAAGEDMPVPAVSAGWVQRGEYLYIVGGLSGDYDNNINATQRYDMSMGTWEAGPTFTSQRAFLALAATGNYLYAIGGDVNGSDLNLQTDLVESLDLSLWPGGSWTDISDPIPQELFMNVGFCTEGMSGGEVWSVGGGYGVYPNYTVIDTNLYRPAEACYDFYFGDLAPESLEGEGYRGATVSYDLTLHNDGTLTDTFDISISGNLWATTAPTEVGPLVPGESGVLSVTVEVPYGAGIGDWDTAVFTATSQGDPGMQDSALITTTAVTDWVEAAGLSQGTGGYGFVQCTGEPDIFYVIGGADAPVVEYLDDLQRYDAVTNQWQELTPMPHGLFAPAATCYEGKIYVAGGWHDIPSRWFQIYDILSDTWTIGSIAPRAFSGAALGAWDGKLYLVGGHQGPIWSVPVPYVDIYDIQTGTWSFNAGELMPVASGYSGWKQAGSFLYVVGGYSGDYDNHINATQRYDMSSNTWQSGPEFTSQRGGFGLAVTQEYLYATGGDANGGDEIDPTALVERLDLDDWPDGDWEIVTDPLPVPVQANWGGFCTEAMAGGEVWSTGGFTETVDIYAIPNNYYRPAEPCLGYNFSPELLPGIQSGEGLTDTTVTYTLTLTNAGDTPDAFDLTASSSWTVTLSGLQGALDAGESVTLTVDVHIPVEATPYDMDTTTITATSQGDSSMIASAILTTAVLPEYGVQVSPEVDGKSGYPGQMMAYSLTLSNTGTFTDTYDLTASGNNWEVGLPVTTTTVGAGEMVEVIVHVTVPEDATAGESDITVITATSQGDPGVQAMSMLTTTARWHSTYLPLIERSLDE